MPENNNVKLTFLGGAGTVTGSKTLLETAKYKVLIDCGLFQGLKSLRLLNWEKFVVSPSSINAIILTHAHLDHCGYIPLLVKNGFKGEIHCTLPTRDLAELILKDSAKIQEEDARAANLFKYSKHKPAKPLYTQKDVDDALPFFIPHEKNEWFLINEDIKLCFRHQGHILGSAFVEMKCLNKRILFSGDVGRKNPLILYPSDKPRETDYLILESTYGDRLHSSVLAESEIEEIVNKTMDRGGIVMIPCFAVGRAQELLFLINELKEKNKIADVPVYFDSPMGIEATEIMQRYGDWHKLSDKQVKQMCIKTSFIKDFAETQELVKKTDAKIIIAGSGMVTGGRILYYLKHLISNENNAVLLVGYQPQGTRGRLMLDGTQEIKFYGEYHSVKAQVFSLSSLSAHADQAELLDWLNKMESPKNVFINHGEPQQSETLRTKIMDTYHWKCELAKPNYTYLLD